ncbi:VPLPA-CTERM sorting domain-containing protein [Ruegeria pomeroyi]|nr:VPLPA-CTERM sorting domain-containing protein [Ruegeria pomeroyi]
MKHKTLLAAAAFAIAIAAPLSAAPIKLVLSFDGVTASFFGLDDGVTGSQSATSWSFAGVLDTYGGTSSITNEFVFSSGNLVYVDFYSNAPVPGTNLGVNFLETIDCFSSLLDCYSQEFTTPTSSQSSIFFRTGTATVTTTPITPIPLPAGGVLLLSALAGAALLKRPKKGTA